MSHCIHKYSAADPQKEIFIMNRNRHFINMVDEQILLCFF